MNLVVLLLILAGAAVVFWTALNLVLRWHGQPISFLLPTDVQIPAVRWTIRVLIQLYFISIIVLFPFGIGKLPSEYYGRVFALPDWSQLFLVSVCSPALFVASFALEWVAGWVRFEPQLEPRQRRAKLIRRFLTPVPLATMEEVAFRGVLLEQLLQVFPADSLGAGTAVAISSAAFSAAHFAKPIHLAGSAWRIATGLFAVGCLCGVAYVCSGRTLWLPIVIHAAGIWITELSKLYTVYEGSSAVIGYPSYPHCGYVGLGTLALLCAGVLSI